MIVFQNPGLIDLDAVRTMGVSVKLPGSFGYFGTGMKFGIATVLRGGGSVVVYRGRERHEFSIEEATIRDVVFRMVCMDGVRMGMTDQLGRNWEPWMVLRELGCNALDEGGTYQRVDSPESLDLSDDTTTVVVEWPELDEVWEEKETVFVGQRPEVYVTSEIQVLEGRSDYLFYRGVRAYRLQHPSVVTYNVLSQQTLSEDRNIASFYYPMGEIRALWLERCRDPKILLTVLCPESPAKTFEDTITYLDTQREPSREFIDVVLDARKRRDGRLVDGAKAVVERHMRKRTESGGYTRSRFMNDRFGQVVEALQELIQEPDDWDLEKVEFVMVEDLPDDELSLMEHSRIYISRELLKQPRPVIADHVLRRAIELWEESHYDGVLNLLVPALLEQHSVTRESRSDPDLSVDEPEDEDEEGDTMSVADSLLAGMHVRGEEYPGFAGDPL